MKLALLSLEKRPLLRIVFMDQGLGSDLIKRALFLSIPTGSAFCREFLGLAVAELAAIGRSDRLTGR